jgi:hypothetical protein
MCAVLCCAVVCCGVLCCGVLWCGVVCCAVLRCGVVWCGVVGCAVMWWLCGWIDVYCVQDRDLKIYMDDYGLINMSNVKVFMFQLLRGLHYCHARKVSMPPPLTPLAFLVAMLVM